MEKQSTKFWYFGNTEFTTLQMFINSLIEKGYTIIAITLIEFDSVPFSKTQNQTHVTKAIILISKTI